MSIKGTFYFDPEDKIYEDHFPGRPVVPGSLIVQAFCDVWQEAGYDKEQCIIEDFRFREFVAPGFYDFSLEPREKGEKGIRCLLHYKGRVIVSGVIKFL